MNITRKLNMKISVVIIMGVLSSMAIFHLLIFFRIISYSVVWAGRLENTKQMYMFEAISLTINILAIIIVGIKGDYIKLNLPEKIVTLLLWGFTILFALNTAGNLFAQSKLEMIIFTPLALIGTVLFYRLASET